MNQLKEKLTRYASKFERRVRKAVYSEDTHAVWALDNERLVFNGELKYTQVSDGYKQVVAVHGNDYYLQVVLDEHEQLTAQVYNEDGERLSATVDMSNMFGVLNSIQLKFNGDKLGIGAKPKYHRREPQKASYDSEWT